MSSVFVALLDTGSVVNLVGRGVVDHLQRQGVEPCRKVTPLRMADGSRSKAELAFRLTADSAGRRWIGDAFYIPTLTTDMILGIDIIKELGLVTVGTKVIYMGVGNDCSGHVGCLDSVTVGDVDPEGPVDEDPRLALSAETSESSRVHCGVGEDPAKEQVMGAIELLTERQIQVLKSFLDEELPKFDAVPGKTHLLDHEIRLKEGVVPGDSVLFWGK